MWESPALYSGKTDPFLWISPLFLIKLPAAWEQLLLAPCKLPSVRVPSPLRRLMSQSNFLCVYIYLCIHTYTSNSSKLQKRLFPLTLISPCQPLIFETSDSAVLTRFFLTVVHHKGVTAVDFSVAVARISGSLSDLIFSKIQGKKTNRALSPVEDWRGWKSLWCAYTHL